MCELGADCGEGVAEKSTSRHARLQVDDVDDGLERRVLSRQRE